MKVLVTNPLMRFQSLCEKSLLKNYSIFDELNTRLSLITGHFGLLNGCYSPYILSSLYRSVALDSPRRRAALETLLPATSMAYWI